MNTGCGKITTAVCWKRHSCGEYWGLSKRAGKKYNPCTKSSTLKVSTVRKGMKKIMKGFIKGFLFAVVAVSLGCYPGLQKEAESPQQALSRVRFFFPEFSDDLDRASFAKALQENLEYLRRLSPKFIFDYGPDQYTAEQVIRSQEFFINLLSDHQDNEELNRRIKRNFSSTKLWTGEQESSFHRLL
jgi:hypothetical protein